MNFEHKQWKVSIPIGVDVPLPPDRRKRPWPEIRKHNWTCKTWKEYYLKYYSASSANNILSMWGAMVDEINSKR